MLGKAQQSEGKAQRGQALQWRGKDQLIDAKAGRGIAKLSMAMKWNCPDLHIVA